MPCVDGEERPYLSLDSAASTAPLESVRDRVYEFLPWYSSIHRGAGYKSRVATAAYEEARLAALRFADRHGDDIAIFCRNTTEAINILAYRLRLSRHDIVVTTVVEHHANLLPWSRAATCRYVECDARGTFGVEDIRKALDTTPLPRLLAITGASNITGWLPPIDEIIAAAHAVGVRVLVDAAQLAPHRPLPRSADFVAWSGHKMYAPFGCGVLVGPRSAFEEGDPFLVGGGAVELVDLDRVIWTDPPDREEAGSPNVVGAVALHAAMETLAGAGWPQLVEHDRSLARMLHSGLESIAGVRVLGPSVSNRSTAEIPTVAFEIEGMSHALVAARLSAEYAIGVRHGCFCAHPYLIRLLGLSERDVTQFRQQVVQGDRSNMPGAVRASAGVNVTEKDIERFLDSLERVASGEPSPVEYRQDPESGDFSPATGDASWQPDFRSSAAYCSRG